MPEPKRTRRKPPQGPARSRVAPAPPAGRRPARLRDRRTQILDTATRLFHEKGFAATSMQDVSDDVGLLKGSLYHHFESKEALLFEILKDLHEQSLEIVRGIVFGSDDPLHQLAIYLRALCIYGGEHGTRLSIFFRDFRFVKLEQQKIIIAERDVYRQAATKLIVEAQKRGDVDEGLHAGVVAMTIMDAVAGLHSWYRTRGDLSLDRIAEQTVSLILNGLRNSGGTRRRSKK